MGLSNFFSVGRSSLPFYVSCGVYSLATSLLLFLKYGLLIQLIFSMIGLSYFIYLWSYLIIIEGGAGFHSYQMESSMKFTFMLFLLSEAMFFFSIFWAFFDAALSPSIELGEEWSPSGINPINPLGIPLFNTVVLLSSGITLTWSHNNLLYKYSMTLPMTMTIGLAFLFEMGQYIEYSEATFSMSDGIYGSLFYFGTGFHGLHVILGHIFLIINSIRAFYGHFSRTHHLSFEFAIIYWHFVDVIWLLLYLIVYFWSFK